MSSEREESERKNERVRLHRSVLGDNLTYDHTSQRPEARGKCVEASVERQVSRGKCPKVESRERGEGRKRREERENRS